MSDQRPFDPSAALDALRSLVGAIGLAAPVAPPAPTRPRLLTVAEFADHIGVALCTVRTMCSEGMPHRRPRPRLIRIDLKEAEAWIESRRDERAEARRRGRIDGRKGTH